MLHVRFVIITVLSILVINPAFAQSSYYDGPANGESVSSQYDDSATDYPKVTNFEKQLYKRVFVGQNIYSRVARIENSLFNKSFENEELIDRVDRISDALGSKNSNSSDYDSDDDISSSIPLNDINRLEQSTFGRSFQNENPVLRIKRLENELLGAAQSGDMNYRLERLKVAAQNQGLGGFNDMDSACNIDLGGGSSGFRSYTMKPSLSNGLLNYLLPYLQNLLNNNNNGFDDDFLNPYQQRYTNYGTAAGVHIIK